MLCPWWKENLLNHKKVSKYYEYDCLQNFILLFMSSLTSFIVKNSRILTGIYFIFLTKRSRPNLKGFQYQIWTSVVRQILCLKSSSANRKATCEATRIYRFLANSHACDERRICSTIRKLQNIINIIVVLTLLPLNTNCR